MTEELLNHIVKEQVCAIIPARSGSKGMKDKNIRLLKGHPLIAYAVAAAKQAKNVDRVIVSTDSEKYAEIAREYGAETPFLRPVEISGDTSTDLEFIQHAIFWFYEHEGKVPEYWVHLRTTNPLRHPESVDEAIQFIKENKEATALLSVNAPQNILTPYKWLIKDEQYLKSIFFDNVDAANMPRQSYPEAYIRTLVVDIIKTETILREQKLFGSKVLAFDTEYYCDIDDEKSFAECEALLREYNFDILINYCESRCSGC